MTEPSSNDAKEIVFVNQKEVCCNRGAPIFLQMELFDSEPEFWRRLRPKVIPLPDLPELCSTKVSSTRPRSTNFGGVVFSAGMTLNHQHADVIVTAEAGKLTAVAHGGEFIDGIGTNRRMQIVIARGLAAATWCWAAYFDVRPT